MEHAGFAIPIVFILIAGAFGAFLLFVVFAMMKTLFGGVPHRRGDAGSTGQPADSGAVPPIIVDHSWSNPAHPLHHLQHPPAAGDCPPHQFHPPDPGSGCPPDTGSCGGFNSGGSFDGGGGCCGGGDAGGNGCGG